MARLLGSRREKSTLTAGPGARCYRRAMAGMQEEEALGRSYDWRLMRRLLGYVRPYRGQAGAAVGLIVLSSLMQLVGPLVTAV
ncbi:MAG TPA: hypothetical protein PK413_10295, partial [Thermoanaerobaculia bacterium]|nr:hypothetical protein [Thermoanaerobaculia bacterium]